MARGTIPTALDRLPLRDKVQWLYDRLAGTYTEDSSQDWVLGQVCYKELAFDAAVTTITSETDLGWDLPSPGIVLDVWLRVDTVDATETLDVGILSTEGSGDADGFLDGVSLATAGVVQGTLDSGGQTLGTLLHVDESGGGVLTREPHIVVADSQSISITASAGTDTAAGRVCILYLPLA